MICRQGTTQQLRWSPWAITALCCAAISLLFFPIFFGPLAVIFSAIAVGVGDHRHGFIALGLSLIAMILGFILGILGFWIGYTGALSPASPDSGQVPISSPVNSESLSRYPVTVGHWQWTKDTDGFGAGHIEGHLTNDSGRRLRYVEVSFTTFNASGYQLGRAMDNILDLEPGFTWKFSAFVWDDDVTYVRGPTVEFR